MPKLDNDISKKRYVSLSSCELKKIYDLGFRNFKIQGRDANLYLFFHDLLRYTLDNEIEEPTIFAIMSNFIETFIKRNKYGF